MQQDTYNEILKLSAEQMRMKCEETLRECKALQELIDNIREDMN